MSLPGPAAADLRRGDEVAFHGEYEWLFDEGRLIGGKPVPLPLREENDFSIDHDELRRLANPNTKLIILNSPQNPTGGSIPEADMRAIADAGVRIGADPMGGSGVHYWEPIAEVHGPNLSISHDLTAWRDGQAA